MTLSSNTPYSHSFNAVAEVSVPDVLSVAEDEGTVQVCATLITPFVTEFDITVTLATSNGTGMCVQQLTLPCVNNVVPAINGYDYLGVSMDLVFTAGTSNGTMQCINVAIIDDSLVESNETFTVTLTTSNSVVELGENLTTITITDTDSMQ